MIFEFGANRKFHYPALRKRCGALLLAVEPNHMDGRLDWGDGGLYLANGKPDPWLKRSMKFATRRLPQERSAAKTLTDDVVFGGIMKPTFGHFFCESIGRMWALERLGSDIPIAFVASESIVYGQRSTPQAFFDLIELKNKIVIVQEPTSCPVVWHPTDLFRPLLGEGMHPRMRRWFMARLPKTGANFAERLYVTRSGLAKDKGRILGEKFVEDGLAQEGYQIFRPEEHSLSEQIDAYANASQIVASESSAVHLMSIVANERLRIAIIRRRPFHGRVTDGAGKAFLTKKVHLISAFRQYWRAPLLGNYNAVAQIDFDYLWQSLCSDGFVRDVSKKPVPTEYEIGTERLSDYGDREFQFALAPGMLYLNNPDNSPDQK